MTCDVLDKRIKLVFQTQTIFDRDCMNLEVKVGLLPQHTYAKPEISIFRRFRHTAFVDNNANVRVADDIKRSTLFTAPLSLAQGEMLR